MPLDSEMARTSCIRAWGVGNIIVMVVSRKKRKTSQKRLCGQLTMKCLELNGKASGSVGPWEG